MWNKIKKMLDEKQITTYQLSKLTGISEQSFSKLRNGLSKELSFGSMVKIADALDISLDEFR
ncbi:helix-turn-helix domain-containing protein [Lactococcus raffinolactis]|uniref:helix-turn-helix domain-containing protein n=1 Tax=Pseudolactococcus raffinolactis TaxID=1366 RepID=UPI00077BE7CD|nr:helix-turn-helix transcriptional regulator [Lactococcus raffinolactis]MDN5415180.1 helix-turn-helix transcriptional regulator [Lactococcus raffinolactis]MDN5493887.1 helix-turn-helix transcriptional regulator [Lactococcus raffinolactis]MDN5584588.1 helix-turn-helix transcriptional regulator [Lactobacillus sp.]PCS11398.1 XRE family transcriptional regulator [Lactococcus raffinolactis]